MKLALGTAQFGFDYGISNTRGEVPLNEIEKILQLPIRTIDTAYHYGRAEEKLGQFTTRYPDLKIISKTAHCAGNLDVQLDFLKKGFFISLQRLNVSRLYGLLIHDIKTLNENVYKFLLHLKTSGLVEKIGASVYSAQEIEFLLAHFDLDLLQAPVSLFDQRLIQSDIPGQLKIRNIEFHARSVFLQGVLLMSEQKIPDYLSGIRPYINKLNAYCQTEGLTPLQLALAFVEQQDFVDHYVVGVTASSEWAEIIQTNKHLNPPVDFASFAIEQENLVNPVLWQRNL